MQCKQVRKLILYGRPPTLNLTDIAIFCSMGIIYVTMSIALINYLLLLLFYTILFIYKIANFPFKRI